MVRVRLKGVNCATKTLADGAVRTYWYAWRDGPSLRGEPGTPEFVASYNEAVAAKAATPHCVILSILQGYQASEDFRGLADSTRRSYVPLIKRVEKDFGDFPLSALTDRRTRGVFMAWRDKIAASSGRRQADYAWSVLARVLSWALDRGIVAANPCTHGGRLYRGSRAEKIWTAADEATFLERAPAHAPAALARAVDRPAARRPLALALVGLRRGLHPAAPIQDRAPRADPRRCAVEARARRRAEALDHHADYERR
jgi:hypothetical protein